VQVRPLRLGRHAARHKDHSHPGGHPAAGASRVPVQGEGRPGVCALGSLGCGAHGLGQGTGTGTATMVGSGTGHSSPWTSAHPGRADRLRRVSSDVPRPLHGQDDERCREDRVQLPADEWICQPGLASVNPLVNPAQC